MNAKLPEDLGAMDYPVRIEYDREDSLYVASFADLPGCSASGSSVAEAHERALEAKAEWLRAAREQGLPIPKPSKTGDYSGRILVRLPSSLHGMLAERARSDGTSLNQFIVHLLSAGAVGENLSGKLEALSGRMQGVERQLAAQSAYGRIGEFVVAASARSGLPALQTSPHQGLGSAGQRPALTRALDYGRLQ
jgi:antitoxin HicB